MSSSEDTTQVILTAVKNLGRKVDTVGNDLQEFKLETAKARLHQEKATSELLITIERRLAPIESDQKKDNQRWNWMAGITAPVIVSILLQILPQQFKEPTPSAQHTTNTPCVSSPANKGASTCSRGELPFVTF